MRHAGEDKRAGDPKTALRVAAATSGVLCTAVERAWTEDAIEDRRFHVKVFYFASTSAAPMSMSLDGFADFQVGKRYRIVVEELP